MGAPNINISFIEKATTAIMRGERGVVTLLVKDTLPPQGANPIMILLESDIPKGLSGTTVGQVKLAMLGYVNAPKKVLVYCMGIPDDAEPEEIGEGYKKALDALETIKFNYLAIPTVQTDGQTEMVSSWVKNMRRNKKKKIKAVLPDTPADDEGVINFTTGKNVRTEPMTSGDGTATIIDVVYTAEQYCARIAGLIAGTPMNISCTYAPLPELSDCTRLNDIDTPVDKGEFILFHDGEKVKTVGGVNSFVKTVDGKGESFKKIKIVEAMDMINDDITKTVQDGYLGKYANSYNNKCVLLVAIGGYFKQLLKDEIISSYTVDIDIEAQTNYLQSKGIDTSELSEDEIRVADTGSKVFLKGNVKILDAIEDITMPIYI